MYVWLTYFPFRRFSIYLDQTCRERRVRSSGCAQLVRHTSMLLRRLGCRVHRSNLTARAPLLSRARSRCSQPEEDGLVPAELVNSWMDDEKLVDASLWPHRRLEMWLQLRTLNGIDLPSFLQGSAHAYVVVQTLMYEREWEALEPLVSPNCLQAMQETMEHMGSVAQRVQLDEGNIVVRSNVLRKVMVLQPGDSVAQGDGTEAHVPRGSCQLDVHFSADESFRIFVRERALEPARRALAARIATARWFAPRGI